MIATEVPNAQRHAGYRSVSQGLCNTYLAYLCLLHLERLRMVKPLGEIGWDEIHRPSTRKTLISLASENETNHRIDGSH